MSLISVQCLHCHNNIYAPPDVESKCPCCSRKVIARGPHGPPKANAEAATVKDIYTVLLLGGLLCWLVYSLWPEPDRPAHVAALREATAREYDAVKVSAWDGSVDAAKRFIASNVRSPDSVKFHEWKNFSNDAQHITTVDFTAVNGFGGPSRETWVFSFEKNTGKLKSVLANGKSVLDAP